MHADILTQQQRPAAHIGVCKSKRATILHDRNVTKQPSRDWKTSAVEEGGEDPGAPLALSEHAALARIATLRMLHEFRSRSHWISSSSYPAGVNNFRQTGHAPLWKKMQRVEHTQRTQRMATGKSRWAPKRRAIINLKKSQRRRQTGRMFIALAHGNVLARQRASNPR